MAPFHLQKAYSQIFVKLNTESVTRMYVNLKRNNANNYFAENFCYLQFCNKKTACKII